MKFASITGVFATLVCVYAASGCANLAGNGSTEGDGVTAEPLVNATVATGYPEAAILNMYTSTGVGYACSATLVAPRVVLTAGHCVDGYARWEVYVGTTMLASSHAVTYDWHQHGSTAVDPGHHDIGLVFLPSALSLAHYPTLATSPVGDGTSATDVGRMHDGAITETDWASPVTLTNGAPYGYPLDYEGADVIEHGDSGGPVFESGTHTIIAVNSGAGSGTEVVARVDLLGSWIAAQIAANGGMIAGNAPTPASAPAPANEDTSTVPANCEPVPGNSTSLAEAADLAACDHGTLAHASATYFAFSASPSRTYTLRLSPTGDAVFSVGVLSGTEGSPTCTPVATGQTALRVTVSGSPRSLCVIVASASHAPQGYTLTLSH